MQKKIKILLTILIVFFVLLFILVFRYTATSDALANAKVTVERITFQELRVTYCKLSVYSNISNPAAQDVSDLTATFDVYIAGTYVGNGSFPKTFIRANSFEHQEVIVTIYYANMANAVIDAIQDQQFVLSMKGQLHGNTFFNLVPISTPFTATYTHTN
jgi:hypothetical protein